MTTRYNVTQPDATRTKRLMEIFRGQMEIDKAEYDEGSASDQEMFPGINDLLDESPG